MSTPPSPLQPSNAPITPPNQNQDRDAVRNRSRSTVSTHPTTSSPHHTRQHPSTPKTNPHLNLNPSTPRTKTFPPTLPQSFHPGQTNNVGTDPFHLEIDSPLHFSPSKARAFAQETQQISVLTQWISSLALSPSVPPLNLPLSTSSNALQSLIPKWTIEHRQLRGTNPELAAQMTAWLQACMAMNRLADERARLVFEAKEAEVRKLEWSAGGGQSQIQGATAGDGGGVDIDIDLLGYLQGSLSPSAQADLESLATTMILLGHIPSASAEGNLRQCLAQRVMRYTLDAQDQLSNVERLEILQAELETWCDEARVQLVKLEEETAAAIRDAEVMHPQTARWGRETKQVSAKVKEYSERVKVLERSRPVPGRGREDVASVEDVVEIQERVREKTARVRNLEKSMSVLHGLPPDIEASRNEVRRAKLELERLKTKREALFSMLADT